MRSVALAQNFLRNRRTARKLVFAAAGPLDAVCVDLGAGGGTITDAALLRDGPVVAIEKDARLAARLRQRYRDEPRVSVVEDDIMTAPIPHDPFVIAANPPFNQGTALVRRWMLARSFVSGAIIVERAFAQRVSGEFGGTKLSLSLAPFVAFDIPFVVRAAEFSPAPRVATAVLKATARQDPLVARAELRSYFLFIHYLFERSRRTVGEALQPLAPQSLPRSMLDREVGSLSPAHAVALFQLVASGRAPTLERIAAFDRALPKGRRSDALVEWDEPRGGVRGLAARSTGDE